MRVLATLLLLVVAAPARADPVVNAPADGARAGATLGCIERRLIRSIKPDGSDIVFRMSSGRDFRAPGAGRCRFVPGAQRFVTRGTTSRLCAGDILDVVDNGGGAGGASCQVGRFTAIERAAAR